MCNSPPPAASPSQMRPLYVTRWPPPCPRSGSHLSEVTSDPVTKSSGSTSDLPSLDPEELRLGVSSQAPPSGGSGLLSFLPGLQHRWGAAGSSCPCLPMSPCLPHPLCPQPRPSPVCSAVDPGASGLLPSLLNSSCHKQQLPGPPPWPPLRLLALPHPRDQPVLRADNNNDNDDSWHLLQAFDVPGTTPNTVFITSCDFPEALSLISPADGQPGRGDVSKVTQSEGRSWGSELPGPTGPGTHTSTLSCCRHLSPAAPLPRPTVPPCPVHRDGLQCPSRPTPLPGPPGSPPGPAHAVPLLPARAHPIVSADSPGGLWALLCAVPLTRMTEEERRFKGLAGGAGGQEPPTRSPERLGRSAQAPRLSP